MYLPSTCTPGTAMTQAGLSGLGCDCGCNSCGGMGGLTMDGSGLFGSGVFGTGVTLTDISTWTWAEFATAGIGLYVLASLVFTTKHVGRKVSARSTKIRRGFTQ